MRPPSALPRIVLWALLAAAAVGSAGEPEIPVPPWPAILEDYGTTVQETQLPPERWRGGGRCSLPVFDRIWDDWTLLQPEAVNLTRRLQTADSFTSLIAAGAAELDVRTAEMPADPETELSGEGPGSLVEAIAALHADAGRPLDAEQQRDLIRRAEAVPPRVAAMAGHILGVVPSARRAWEAAVRMPDAGPGRPAVEQAGLDLALFYRVSRDVLRLLDRIDLQGLLDGGALVAQRIDGTAGTLARAERREFSFAWDTPYGTVALNGTEDNTYDREAYLLVVDTGGNDVYSAVGTSGPYAGRTSVVIDLAGNDRYTGEERTPWGAGVCGYGFLWDLEGNDTYSCRSMGPGAAALGIGVCVDAAGEDRYEVDRHGQAAACLGVGILDDRGGNDVYRCYQFSQGFAQTKGCGILVERAGNDVYTADNVDIKYPSPQTADANASLSQGVGFGRRAHPGDGYSLGGGVGALIDLAGDDRYSCGVFGQGCSYWYSLGIHVDLGGDDVRTGAWYVQGTAVHYSAGILIDAAGDDEYVSTFVQNAGHAKDNSIAVMYDVAGNDRYECNDGWTLGSSWYSSTAAFYDGGGRDAYRVGGTDTSHTVGGVEGGVSTGIFAAGGKNTWTGELQPARIELPLRKLPDGAGQMRIGISR